MKTAFFILILATTLSCTAQFARVEGRIYSLTDENAGWTPFSNLHIEDVIEGDLICKNFTTATVSDGGYYVANRWYARNHTERVWGEKLVIRNYPWVNRINPGDDIAGPIYANGASMETNRELAFIG